MWSVPKSWTVFLILYPCLEKIKEVILEVASANQEIGDFTSWKKKFNYFNDFFAPQRVGRFIQSFMERAIETNNQEQTLKYFIFSI